MTTEQTPFDELAELVKKEAMTRLRWFLVWVLVIGLLGMFGRITTTGG